MKTKVLLSGLALAFTSGTPALGQAPPQGLAIVVPPAVRFVRGGKVPHPSAPARV